MSDFVMKKGAETPHWTGPVAGPTPIFVIIRGVVGRGFWLALAVLLVAAFITTPRARGDELDDATAQLAKKILGHLAPDQIAQVTWGAPISADAASLPDQARAKALLAKALQRRLRNPKGVDVKATWSQNAKGYLLIAEIKGESEDLVEMVSVSRITASIAPAATAHIEKRLVWEQETRVLDLVIDLPGAADEIMVLDARGLARYKKQDGKWQRIDDLAIDVPVIRDERGRLAIVDDTVLAEVPGTACRGKWRPRLELNCQPGGRFTAGRNTIEDEGWPPHFTKAQWDGGFLVAETDGQIHIYDAARKPAGTFSGWGSDFVAVTSCGVGSILTAGADSHATDNLALYDVKKSEPVRKSDAVEVPGPVTALTPATNGALAVVRNHNTERYEAYNLSVDCGH